MIQKYHTVNARISKLVTRKYSTSFSVGIYLLNQRFHDPIYSIYGLVRYADEIVDSFHGHDKEILLQRFREDTFRAIEEGISLNPILHSFQLVVNTYQIEYPLIEAFFDSMAMDLEKHRHSQSSYEKYILGSAEVVGLMCLRVFCEGDQKQYEALKPAAMKLGSAFQKVNFLRDLKADYHNLGRMYFPNVQFNQFTDTAKKEIEEDIRQDFKDAFEGIKRLPNSSKLGVYTAYVYYTALFHKITRIPPEEILQSRVRVPNWKKFILAMRCCLQLQLRRI